MSCPWAPVSPPGAPSGPFNECCSCRTMEIPRPRRTRARFRAVYSDVGWVHQIRVVQCYSDTSTDTDPEQLCRRVLPKAPRPRTPRSSTCQPSMAPSEKSGGIIPLPCEMAKRQNRFRAHRRVGCRDRRVRRAFVPHRKSRADRFSP